MKGRWCVAFVFAVTWTATAELAQVARADRVLPPLLLEALPHGIREGLSSAYKHALANPSDASAAGRLAMMLHAYEQHHLASQYYEHASQLDPHSIRWAYLAGVAYAEFGANREAIASLRRALLVDRNYLPARLRFAEVLLAEGDLSGSRTEFEEIVRSFPELAVARYGLGRALTALGDTPAAIKQYQEAVHLAPQFGPAHYALGLAVRDTGNVDAATRHLEAYGKFGTRRPAPVDPLIDEVRSMVGTARELIAQGTRVAAAGNTEEAIALHLKALDADPMAAQAHVNLIALYGRSGRVDAAQQHYRDTLRLGSHTADAHYNYGVLMASAGRHVDAADAFRRALDVDPFHTRAHNNLGALLAQQGRREEAISHFRQVLAGDPQHQGARFGLGRLLVALGRPGDAIEHFQKLLIPKGPDTPRYQYALANACFAAGETETGIKYAEAALADAKRAGLTELAASIEQELKRMRAGRR